jgi:hypothetical protein
LNAIYPCHQFSETAKKAIEFEIANAVWANDLIFWRRCKEAPNNAPLSPHMRYGTAGVGSASIRLFAATEDTRFRDIAERCANGVSSRLTNKLWQDFGLSGIGEFLIDMYQFLGDENYLYAAFYLAEGILPYRIFTQGGIAFPGADLLKISCDFASGSAGIGLFFHRLLNPRTPRLMFPDSLLSVGTHVTGRGETNISEVPP